MSDFYSTAVATNAAVLALSKIAWTVGVTLSFQSTVCAELCMSSLADDVKALGHECDQLFVESTELLRQKEIHTNHIDVNLWSCLAPQIEELEQIMRQLESFTDYVKRRNQDHAGWPWEAKKIEQYREHLTQVRIGICKHTVNLRTFVVLMRTLLAYAGPHINTVQSFDELAELEVMVDRLQVGSEARHNPALSSTDTTLVGYTQEVSKIVQSPQAASFAEDVCVPRYEIPGSIPFHLESMEPSKEIETCKIADQSRSQRDLDTSNQHRFSKTFLTVQDQDFERAKIAQDQHPNDTADELNLELVAAAIDAGTQCFEVEAYGEAEAFFLEAQQTLLQLPTQQQALFDVFTLRYKLAACSFHTRESAVAEGMLSNLVKQPAVTEEQSRMISKAQHLLVLSYIRLGQMERAKSQCEVALLMRRRVFGKTSFEAFESTAALAHIHLLLNNRARARSYIAIIPEEHREAAQRGIEEKLAMDLERLETSSAAVRSSFGGSDHTSPRIPRRLSATSSASSVGRVARADQDQHRYYTSLPCSPSAKLQRSHMSRQTSRTGYEDNSSVATMSYSVADGRSASTMTNETNAIESQVSQLQTVSVTSLANPTIENSSAATLSRRDILQRIGCAPTDSIEEAVCDGDKAAFDRSLSKKKDSWRSKLRKHVRAERVTALHFAALFGEIDMARKLIASTYNVNEAPFGYSTVLTPLTFAIGARQVGMTELLTDSGARPVEPESWATLAGQVLNKSWLSKTLSEAGKQPLATQVIAIFKILLRHGWKINEVIDEKTRRTVLHQAVTFHTGSHSWDKQVRMTISAFLHGQEANPSQMNREGKTSRDLAIDADHQDILRIFDGNSIVPSLQWPVELPV